MAHILVIDDDAALRRVMVRMLQGRGHTVSAAKDGRLGMAEFRRQRPDLVVTDIVMPDSEGIELIRDIRSEPPPQCLVLAISGAFTAEFYLRVAGKLGADACLNKPFRAAEFLNVVEQLLATRPAAEAGQVGPAPSP